MASKDDKFFFGTDKDNMEIGEYLNRINDITEYYYVSCERYKKKFYACCFVRILSSALIPIISLASAINWSTIIVSILAGMITVSEGYENVTRAYEKWTKYREICNALWIEQRQFAMKSGIYANEQDRINLFVSRCEELMIQEVNDWKRYIERAKEMR